MYGLLFVQHFFTGTMSAYVLGVAFGAVFMSCAYFYGCVYVNIESASAHSQFIEVEQSNTYADTMAPDGLMRHCGTKRGLPCGGAITRTRHAMIPQGSLNNYHAGHAPSTRAALNGGRNVEGKLQYARY